MTKLRTLIGGLLLAVAAVGLSVPAPAEAISVSWDRPAVGRINPINILDEVRGNFFTSTSTDTRNTFPLASSSLVSIFQKLYVGGTATTTIDSAGNVVLPTGATLTLGSLSGILKAAGGLVSAGSVALGTDVSGTLPVGNGGTGSTTAPSSWVLYGGGNGTYQAVATGTAQAGTGISVTANRYVLGGDLTITNTAPDQTVALTAGDGITTSGTYPNFTIATPYAIATDTSSFAVPNLLYLEKTGGKTTVGSVATGTISAGSGVSVTAGRYAVGGALTITNTGVTAVAANSPLSVDASTGSVTFSCATCSSSANTIATTSGLAVPQVAYFTKTGGVTTLGGAATTSLSISGPFTIPSAIGVLNNGTVNYWGLATTSAISQGQVLYATGVAGVASAATSTPTAVDLTISGTGATIGSLSILNPYAIATTSGIAISQLPYYTQTGGKTTIGGVATSTVSNGAGISISGTAAVVGTGGLTITNSSPLSGLTTSFPLSFSNPTLSWIGLATTSQPTAGQMLYSNGTNGLTPVSTTSATINNGLTGTLTTLNSGGSQTIGLATINAGVLGSPVNGAVPTSQATSTLYGVGTGGFVLAWNNGVPQWVATSSINNGVSSLTGTANQITASASTGAVTLSLPSLVIFPGNASSSQLSVVNKAYFGATATTTIDSVGNIVLPVGANLTDTGTSDGCATFASGVLGSTGIACGSGAGTSAYEIATTSDIAVPQVAYFTKTSGRTTLASAATTTLGGGTTGLSFSNSPVVLGGSASALSGTLILANGGTNATSFSVGNVVYANSGGTALTNTGSATSTPTAVDLTISGTGATIGSLSILNPYAIATTSGIAVSQLPYYTATGGRTTISGVATTTLGGGTTGLTFSNSPVVIGATPSALSGTLAIANGGTNQTSFTTNGIDYFDGTRLTNGTALNFDAARTAVGIGTSTPRWNLTAASSTGPQLTLTDTSATNAPFNFRAVNTQLYFSTSSPTTFATTSTAILSLDSNTASTTAQKLSVSSMGYIQDLRLGTALTPAFGGTGLTSVTANQIIYGNSGGTAYLTTATSSLNLSVAGGGTGVVTLTGVAIGNGTSAFTAGSTQTCTNQFIRVLSNSYVATCATVGAGDVSLANLTATDSTLTFSGTYNGSTARTIGLNLAQANTWTGIQTFNGAGVGVTGFLAQGLAGIGTTTPKWSLTIASSTGPQLTLTDGSTTGAPFNFRAINNLLYISTSSPTTFATTSSAIFALDKSTASTTVQHIDSTSVATSSFAGGINMTSGCFAKNGNCLPTKAPTFYYASSTSAGLNDAVVQISVQNGDIVQVWGAMNLNSNCSVSDNSADFIIKRSNYAASTTIANLGTHRSGSGGCSSEGIYQETATTTATWYFETVRTAGTVDFVTTMAQQWR